MSASITYLMDGPLCALPARRQALIERMAETLHARPDGLSGDREAVRVLLSEGFATIDVAMLVGEARMLAYQEIVAREMSKP